MVLRNCMRRILTLGKRDVKFAKQQTQEFRIRHHNLCCLFKSQKYFEGTGNSHSTVKRFCSTLSLCQQQSKQIQIGDIHISITENGNFVQVTWENGTQSVFHSIWLRNNCHCPRCKQDHSGQKLLDVGQINHNTTVAGVSQSEGRSLIVQWQDECHTGVIPLDFLFNNSYNHLDNKTKHHIGLDCPTSLPMIEYSDIIASQIGVLRWLRDMNEHGICVLKNVPQEDGMVCKMAEKIAPVQETIYGIKFDVVSTPNPINVAYSDVGLDFHMDLIYYESAPGLQLLHCMKFDDCVEGGESIILDLFHVAEVFRKNHPQEFHVLTRIPTTFQKIHYQRGDPVHMVYQKPIIFLNHRDEIIGINWAPAFEGPLSVRFEDVHIYYKAYHKFAEAIQTSPALLELKMVPGDLLAFNNRRLLHGRKSFKLNGGMRHLQGCYVNIDHYKSKLQVLSTLLSDKRPVKRVGNQCWL